MGAQVAQPDGSYLCRCGCGGTAAWRVESEELDGSKFVEYCCGPAREYLSSAAAEMELPYKEERVL